MHCSHMPLTHKIFHLTCVKRTHAHNQMAKPDRPKISGGFFVHKPYGITCRQLDNKISYLAQTKKVGHIGTLDPLAEGLVPVLVGYATRLAPFLDSGIKAYRASVMLGTTTETDDREGKIIDRQDVTANPSEIFAALKTFVGEIDQVPPKFSAKQTDGKRHYELARKGLEVEAKPVRVTIFSIENVEMDLPYVSFDVECSTGTYLRSIARDLGRTLGCGAHLSGLLRTRVGPHTLSLSTPFAKIIESFEQNEPKRYLVPELKLIPHIPCVHVDAHDIWRISQGQILPRYGRQFLPNQVFVFADGNENILAIVEKNIAAYSYLRVLPRDNI